MSPDPQRRPPRLAVIVSRFPKVSETFQLQEIIALEQLGVPIELFAITHHREPEVQPEAVELDRRAHHLPRLAPELVRAHLTWLRRDPRALLDCWTWSVRELRRSPEALLRSLVVVPLAAAWALRMERLGIEHVHAHYATYPTHAAWVVRRLAGIPYSFTGHAHDLRWTTAGLAAKIEAAEYFVTCTSFAMEDLRQLFGEVVTEKGVVAHHGVRTDVFAAQPTVPDDGDRPFRMVCVASFEECKGHRYLLDAVRLLRDRGVDLHLDLVGGNLSNGFDYRSLMVRRAEELGIDDVVSFRGQQTSDEVRRHLAAADVGVLACCRTADGSMDGLPNFLTECLATGRPVVTTDLAGPRELVVDGENGLVVRTRDAGALADALEQLRTDPRRRAEMGAAGRARVEAEHDLLRNTRQLYELLVDRVGRCASEPPPS